MEARELRMGFLLQKVMICERGIVDLLRCEE